MTGGYGGVVRRSAWLALVLAAALLILRGMVLTTYFEPTGDALALARVGRRWLWAGTLTLWATCALAFRWWQPGLWSLGCLAVVGPVVLLLESWGWIPLVAVLPGLPLLLVGVAGVLMAPPRRVLPH